MLKQLIKSIVFNQKIAIYSESMAKFCRKYMAHYYGDNDPDRMTNGEIRLLKSLSGKINTAFDVGANVGDYSKDIIKFNPNCKVHSFEPDPRAFKELNKIDGVIANNFALGEAEQDRQININKKSTHNSFYSLEENENKQLVQIKTLDSYVSVNKINSIDFLKIDTEGYEYNVLLGSKNTLESKIIKYIQFEFSGANVYSRVFLKDFIDLLEPNYQLYRIRSNDIKPIKWNPELERFTLTNYLAIRKDLLDK